MGEFAPTLSPFTAYAPFVYAAVSGLGLPAFLHLLSRLVRLNRRTLGTAPMSLNLDSKLLVRGRGLFSGPRIHVPHFLAATGSLFLTALALLILPCVITLQQAERAEVRSGLLAMLVLSGLCACSLFYAVRRGDLGHSGAILGSVDAESVH